MGTAKDAQAVKSLNKSPGHRQFVFQTFSQRLEGIEIDVFRSLHPLKSEPSEGSSFFRDCLVEWRELNTAEDFISLYEEIVPMVQTLPQIILHKELILSKLLSRLHMEGRLSLEPILRLIAALSRDLLEEFPQYLQRVADALVYLLKSGADREPEIIEQIFTSWSHIMMYLQKYLVRDVVHVLRVSAKLRYYPKDYVQEFMAEAVSFLLRSALTHAPEQFIKGIRKVMAEAAKKPQRKSGASALLWNVMRGASLKLHSRAEQVLRLLMDDSTLHIGDKFVEGSQSVLEVVTIAFQRLCEEFEPTELKLLWDCLLEEIRDAVYSEGSLHLCYLLSLLISTAHKDYIQKLYDYKPMLEVVDLIMQKFVSPSGIVKTEDQSSEVVDKLLQLVLCIVDGLHIADNVSVLSQRWTPLFKLRNASLLTFIKQLLLKDPHVVHAFRSNILSALSDLMETFKEEVTFLLLIFLERIEVHVQSSDLLDGTSNQKFSRICTLQDAFGVINQIAHGDPSSVQLPDTTLAFLWGVISCYPFMSRANSSLILANSSLILEFVVALDKLLVIEYDNIAGFHKHAWQSLIGAAMSSFNKLNSGNPNREEAVSTFLQVAARHKSSSHILSAAADFLDSIDRPTFQEETSSVVLHPELKANKAKESLALFAENLCHSDKVTRVSTLRILCHYQLLSCEQSSKDEPAEIGMKTEVSESCLADNQSYNVLQLLLSIEDTPLSITTSRKVILLISRIQMGLSGARIAEIYLPSVLYGLIGILYNRFSYVWDPASDCIAVLISKYFDMTWDIFVQYLEQCESKFLASHDQSDRSRSASTSKSSDLVKRFNLFVSPASDNTPCTRVLTLLIQSLQKVPTVAESRSLQIVPLFLKFVGYNVEDIVSVGSFNTHAVKGKEWKNVLKEWLTLLKLMRNPRSFYRNQFLKEVLQYRLLEENDAEIQMKVLDCLLNWKDDFLVPYDQHLKNLISSKSLREELTTWSLSKESNLIEQRHRSSLLPLLIRVLIPKVRKLKTLASRKHTSVHHRKAVLGFVAQLDVNELRLFFALLIKPLISISKGLDGNHGMIKCFWSSPELSEDEFDSYMLLKYFTVENVMALSWKKRCAFLHVIEDILGVFDELHVKPYLDLLMGCVVRILWSCTSIIDGCNSSGFSVVETHSQPMHEKSGAENQITTSTAIKQFKELRSLCLKVISLVLKKYEDHDLGCDFWDLFFNSVKPLIDGFKREGASSEKPSSLFSCFLTMSGDYKLISLLDREKSLVPDIFSILTVPTASEAILSCVLNFVKNLLNLDSELDCEENAAKRILLPNLDALISGMHCLFKFNNAARRKLAKCPGEREFCMFKLLSKYIQDPSAASKFVDIMLPLLSKQVQNSDAGVEVLHVIQQMIPVLGSERTTEILNAVSPLLISASLDLRTSVCDLLDALAGTDSSLIDVAKLVRELNSTSVMEMGGLDYDIIIGAYGKINKDFFYTVKEKHALVILSHAVHDMSSEELILRQSAFRLLLSYIEFLSELLEREMKASNQSWSESCIHQIINKFFFKHMGDAMNKEASTQKVWIGLLREMVLKLSMVQSLKSLKVLCSEDAEQDFFNNIMHLQKHRRARALLRFRNFVISDSLSEVVTIKVFVPLIFNMLFELQRGKSENVRSACLEALASISGNMEWKSYYTFLMRCFREMSQKSNMQKVLLRLICLILDRFHFMETYSGQQAEGSIVEESKTVLRRCSSSAEVTEIQERLLKSVLPKIQKLLASDSENVNVHISIVALKLLKLLPGDVMELQLPSIVHRISNFLKNRLESIRDEARDALAVCLKELGLEYLQFIVNVLRATLKRGYELHVLGYTLNFILSKFLVNPAAGKLDYCLEDLLSVVENDILGDVSEEKEVEKIASKMKETRKLKSFETLKLIAENITFKTHAVKLLSRVAIHLRRHLTPKLKLKLESMLNSIAAGIECNPSVNQPDLFIFLYDLIRHGISCECHKNSSSTVVNMDKKSGDRLIGKMTTLGKLIDCNSQSSHIIKVFALGLLHSCMKKTKLHKKDEHLSMLDPFIGLLTECLSSKYEDIISGALRCLAPLVGLPLPALKLQGDKIKTSLLVIAQGSMNGSPLMQSCLRLLTVLLRNPRITLSADQLHLVVQFPLFIDLERNPSSIALSLLKAIVNQKHEKLVGHEIYDLVSRVAELMVTSQVESIRKICSQILLQFLLYYRLSEKRLQQHLDFLLSNLSYKHSSGRETVLEMLHAVVMKFPKPVLDEHSLEIFVRLVFCLANDNDNKVRSMTGAAIKLLIGHVSPYSLHSIIEYSLSWYLGGKQDLWSAAAQVLGFLVEVMKEDFRKHISSVLPIMTSIFQSALDDLKNGSLDVSIEAAWKGAYHSLIMLEKILHQFHDLCLGRDLENIWEIICGLLVHPHMWLRNALNRLVAQYFASVSDADGANHDKSLGTFFLMRPSRLFLVAVSFCCQLKGPLIDDAASTLITQNLTFVICALQSFLGPNKLVDDQSIWSAVEHHEHRRFVEAFLLLDSGKGGTMYASFTSGENSQNAGEKSDNSQSYLVSCLLKRMGKIALKMEAVQMKIIFNVFKAISPKIIDPEKFSLQPSDFHGYAYPLLLPVYKVCEGYAGKVIPDDVKQSAQEALETIRDTLGTNSFVQVYSHIRKSLKEKRDKRKRGEKLMAVVNPERNAQRKRRISAKNQANKRRRVMTMKMRKWVR